MQRDWRLSLSLILADVSGMSCDMSRLTLPQIDMEAVLEGRKLGQSPTAIAPQYGP